MARNSDLAHGLQFRVFVLRARHPSSLIEDRQRSAARSLYAATIKTAAQAQQR